MIHPSLNAWVAICSNERPLSVQTMERKVGAPVTWYVNEGAAIYRKAGAQNVQIGPWPGTRNMAMDDAFKRGVPCIQIDDDAGEIKLAYEDKSTRVITFTEAARQLLNGLATTDYKMAGVAPTTNAFYYNPKKPVSATGFVIAAFSIHLPSDLRFDPRLKIKHDYDLTLQHIAKFGGIYRRNDILAEFKHYKNPGGLTNYRNHETEEREIDILIEKWGDKVRRNPKRRHEILI